MNYDTTTTPLSDDLVGEKYADDKKSVDAFLNHEIVNFDVNALRRLIVSELGFNKAFRYRRFCGFTQKQIVNMIEHPEHYGKSIVRLSKYMMKKSGYYKRLVEYFVNMALGNWTLDKVITNNNFLSDKLNVDTYRKKYILASNQCNKFNIENRITDIFRKLYVEDICFGFVTENDIECSLFLLDYRYCEIIKVLNGNVFQFAINRSLINSKDYSIFPEELRVLLEQSEHTQLNNLVEVPLENSFCIKYHPDFIYPYPVFFGLIGDILLIDQYKDLAKSKTEADAYKLVHMQIPTVDGKVSMGDKLVIPFVQSAKDTAPETWGVITSPFDVQLLESKSTSNDDDTKVADAVESYYSEAGVPEVIFHSATNGSVLKLAMKVDSSDIYRLYRQIDAWVNLQLKIRDLAGFKHGQGYGFVYRTIPTTIFDVDDYIDRQMKLASASFPNKDEVAAASGINPAKLIASTLHESIFDDIYSSWKPLATSYTQSGNGSDNEGGAPPKDDTDITEGTEVQRENGSNDSENRI